MKLFLGLVAAFAVTVHAVPPASADVGARRIVSLAPHLTELVYSAGAGDRLVGVVAYSDFPEAANSLPRVGDAFRVDYEAVLALRPDLILAWDGGNPAAVIVRLRELGLRVETFAPRVLADVATHLRRIGDLTGDPREAELAARDYLQELAELRAAFEDSPPVRVFYQVSYEPLYTVGGRSYINQIIELCGGRNVFSGLDELAAVVSFESVLARDPELIVAGLDSNEELVRQWSRWRDLAAVATNNLRVVDASLTGRASLRLAAGARQICAAVSDARSGRDYSDVPR